MDPPALPQSHSSSYEGEGIFFYVTSQVKTEELNHNAFPPKKRAAEDDKGGDRVFNAGGGERAHSSFPLRF